MKRSILFWTTCALFGFAALGCQEKPEIAFEEYGETAATLPEVENLPATFELPVEADSPLCVMREQAINSAERNRSLARNADKDAASQNATSAAQPQQK